MYSSCNVSYRITYYTSDTVTLYRKDNGTIALANEPKSYQISKHIEQQNMRLSRVEIHRGVESRLHMGCGRSTG